MAKQKIIIPAVLISGLALTGCNMNYEEQGQLIGTIVGGAVGAALGDDYGIGEEVGLVIGMAAGGMIGEAIGAKLDEVDRLKAEMATMSALEMNEETKVSWKSPENKNVSGVVTTENVRNNSGRNCKSVTHVVNIRGEEYRERDTLCQQSDGSWALS